MYILIVTGLSGAGKSTALSTLEDNGYYCMDNLPSALFESCIKLLKEAKPSIPRVAIAIDSRQSRLNGHGIDLLEMLKGANVPFDILFLDCKDEIIELRYNQTRRQHPIEQGSTLKEKIEFERDMLSSMREQASFLLDTTRLKPVEFSHKLTSLLTEIEPRPFSLTVISFGYKRGVPYDADIVMDVRFSPNPFYEPALRGLSGQDQEVVDFVLKDEAVQGMLSHLQTMLSSLIPQYQAQGKRRLMVAFGCTGGRHRSVAIADEFAKRMGQAFPVRVSHRDLGEEGKEIVERFL